MKKIFSQFLCIALTIPVWGQSITHHQPFLLNEIKYSSAFEEPDFTRIVYTSDDSLKVVDLLRQNAGENDVLYYARKLKGLPYVASTLEISDPEKLVVNLRQLDCTTLVETVLALAMTKRQNRDSFSAYCQSLALVRYWKGRMDGYLSRLHYFAWWMHDNMEKGVVENICDSLYFTSAMVVRNSYMSTHPNQYKFLKGRPERVDSIAKLEKKYNGRDGFFLPASLTSLTRKKLSVIHNGDIIAIVTRKKGLDYSHLGFAVWGKDGKLHLLNASSIHHKVVEEPKPLWLYLKGHPSSIGIKVLRLK